ncbi:MAG: DHH family phosphoesterase [Candidatus Hydrothermarchaeaceae archaeon]
MDLFEYVKSISGKILILSHQNADPDAICSSIALKDALGALNPKATILIGAAGGISRSSKRIVEKSEVLINPSLDVELLVILDSSTLQQISPLDRDVKKARKVAVIDHHVPHRDTEDISDFYIVDESASSTAEVIYDLIENAGIEITERASLAILIGILADSAHLRFATPKTLKIVSSILDSGADYQKALDLIEFSEEDVSQKIACLKAAKRAELHRIDDWILVTSKVNAFGARAANGLVSMGADCVFVGSVAKGGVQVSARASQNFLKKTGTNLGRDVMPRVGEFVGGGGGGHREAAGVKSKTGDVNAALDECIRITKEFITRRKG